MTQTPTNTAIWRSTIINDFPVDTFSQMLIIIFIITFIRIMNLVF